MYTARVRTAQLSGRGFTLLEVTLAVAILAMMSLTIYRFVQANVTAMRVSAVADAADARFAGLRQLLMQQLQALPSGAGALLGEPLRVSNRDRDEMTWICGAGPGLMTRYAAGDYRVSLRLAPHSARGNQLDLGIVRKPKDDPAASNAHQSWVPLLENVSSLQIRYFDPRLNSWVQRWTDTVTLPRLVKVLIGRTDSRVPNEMIVPLARTPL
jgi:prepilin-type N-terminal cleavage/methylation domain-containing protein